MPALIFDCDGVLADTERDGHLPAFNQTFAEVGLPVRWSDREYAEKVRIGGGKERMSSLLTPALIRKAGLPKDPTALQVLISNWHQRKTAHYRELIEAGRIPARPGVVRLIDEALADGWSVAVASTSSQDAVRSVVEHVAGDAADKIAIFAGDVVAHKKPAPDIYVLALAGLGVPAERALAIEDSGNGLAAARQAGLASVITVSSYTAADDFTGAALVISSLGDERESVRVIADPFNLHPTPMVHLTDLNAVLAGSSCSPKEQPCSR